MPDGRSTRIIHTGAGGARTRAGSIVFDGIVGTVDGSSATLTADIAPSRPQEPVLVAILGWAMNAGGAVPVRQSIVQDSLTLVQSPDGPCWRSGDTFNCLGEWESLDSSDGIDFADAFDLDVFPVAWGCPVTKHLSAGSTITWTWGPSTPTEFTGILVALKFVDCKAPTTDGWMRAAGDTAIDDCSGGRVSGNGTNIDLDGENFYGTFEGMRFYFAKVHNVTDSSAPPAIFWGFGDINGDPGFPATDVTLLTGTITSPDGTQRSVSAPDFSFHAECYIGYKIKQGPSTDTFNFQWSCPGESMPSGVGPVFNQWHGREVYAFSIAHKDTCSCCPRGLITADRFKGTTDEERATGGGSGSGSGGLGNWMPGTDEPAQYAAAISAAAPGLSYPTQGNAIKVQVGLAPDGKQYYGAVAHNGEISYHDGGAWIWVKYRDPPNAGNTIEVRIG